MSAARPVRPSGARTLQCVDACPIGTAPKPPKPRKYRRAEVPKAGSTEGWCIPINVVYFATIVGVVAVIVWNTLGRTVLRLAALTTELPVGPALTLLDDPAALLVGVRLREIVRWRDDLLVGFHGGRGSWTDCDHVPSRADAPILAGGESTDGQIRVVRGVHDRRIRRLLRLWKSEARSLVAVLSRDGTFALVDVESREAVLGERVEPPR